MAKRKAISKTTRFEVLKRDRFTCRYCGAKSPDVLLVMEHVVPVAEGGGNDIMNLVTACEACNSGKGARLLDDHSRLHAERAELDRMAEEREQLRMMAEWRAELRDHRFETLVAYFETNSGLRLTDHGQSEFRKLLGSMRPNPTDEEVMSAIDTSVEVYLAKDPDKVFASLGGIIRTSRRSVTKPWLRDLYYIRGILRNRKFYVNEKRVLAMMEEAIGRGLDIDEIKQHALDAKHWSDFRARIGDA